MMLDFVGIVGTRDGQFTPCIASPRCDLFRIIVRALDLGVDIIIVWLRYVCSANDNAIHSWCWYFVIVSVLTCADIQNIYHVCK